MERPSDESLVQSEGSASQVDAVASTPALRAEQRSLLEIVRLFERFVAIATILGTILTGLGVWVAKLQYDLNRSTAANQQALTVLSTRPWIRATSIISSDGLVTVAYRNSGHTPTVMMPFVYARFVMKPLLPKDFQNALYLKDELSVTKPTGAALMLVGAETENEDAVRIPKQYITPGDITDPQGVDSYKSAQDVSKALGANTLYVWGAALYADGLHREHEVRFCYEHQPDDKEMYACPFLNVLDDSVKPGEADCVLPQLDGPPSTHPAPCKQTQD